MSECGPTIEGESPINLRGTSQGFEIFIESSADALHIAKDIEKKLDEAPSFFKGGSVTLRFDDVPPSGYLGIIEEVTQRYQLQIVGVQGPEKQESSEDEVLDKQLVEVSPSEETQNTPMVAKVESIQSTAPIPTGVDVVDENAPLAPKMIVGPVRSGCILEFAGHLIVLGDINPGAEVRAAGSIVVLGRLRGIAHAGCEGSSAFILALQMQPQQLRIATLVARAGDSDVAPGKAEIAYAKDGGIMVDYYKGRLPSGIATAKF